MAELASATSRLVSATQRLAALHVDGDSAPLAECAEALHRVSAPARTCSGTASATTASPNVSPPSSTPSSSSPPPPDADAAQTSPSQASQSPSQSQSQPASHPTARSTAHSTAHPPVPTAPRPHPLDCTAYPHILATVLSLAAPTSLLPFRPTCRALCARIDAALYAHITFERTETTTLIPSPTALRPIERTDVVETVRTLGGLHARLDDARLTHTEVLEAWGGRVPPDLLRALPSLRVLRTRVPAPLALAVRGRPGAPPDEGGETARLPRPATLVRLFNVHDRRASFAWSAFGAPRTVFVLEFDPRYPGLLRHDVFDDASVRSLDCPRFYVILAPAVTAPGSEGERLIRDACAARDDPSHPAHHGMLAEGGLLNVLARGVSEWRDHWRRDRRTGRPRQTFTFVGWESWEEEWLSPRFRRWRDSTPLLGEEGEGAPGPSSAAGADGANGNAAEGGSGSGDIRARFLRWVMYDTESWGGEVRTALRESIVFMTRSEFASEVGDATVLSYITGDS